MLSRLLRAGSAMQWLSQNLLSLVRLVTHGLDGADSVQHTMRDS